MPPTDGSGTKVIQIANVSPAATRDQLYTLLSFLGRVVELKLYPVETNPAYTNYERKVSYVRFDDPASVSVAQHLTGTVFIDRALVCVPVPDGQIPDEDAALKMGVPGQSGTRKLPTGMLNQIQAVNGQQVIVTVDPSLSGLGLPSYPPLPMNTDASRIEEIRRTIYVGNIPKDETGQELLDFINEKIGEVMFLRFAGDDSLDSRYAYVEFSQIASIATALQMTNVLEFKGNKLRFQHSTAAIQKPQTKTAEAAQREIEEAMKKTNAASSLITKAVDIETARSSSYSRYSSSHRSRSPLSRRRSRSHSGGRHSSRRSTSKSRSRRSRSRSKSRDRRSRRSDAQSIQAKSIVDGSRSRNRRSRSRTPSRDRRRRSKDRSVSRDRRRRSSSRSPDRDHDRKKDRRSKDEERERAKEKERQKEKAKEEKRLKEKEAEKQREREKEKEREKERRKKDEKSKRRRRSSSRSSIDFKPDSKRTPTKKHEEEDKEKKTPTKEAVTTEDRSSVKTEPKDEAEGVVSEIFTTEERNSDQEEMQTRDAAIESQVQQPRVMESGDVPYGPVIPQMEEEEMESDEEQAPAENSPDERKDKQVPEQPVAPVSTMPGPHFEEALREKLKEKLREERESYSLRSGSKRTKTESGSSESPVKKESSPTPRTRSKRRTSCGEEKAEKRLTSKAATIKDELSSEEEAAAKEATTEASPPRKKHRRSKERKTEKEKHKDKEQREKEKDKEKRSKKKRKKEKKHKKHKSKQSSESEESSSESD